VAVAVRTALVAFGLSEPAFEVEVVLRQVPVLPSNKQASALSIFNFRVEGLEFGACVVNFELPIDPALLRITGR